MDVDGLADDANANAKTSVEATAGADAYCLSYAVSMQCNAGSEKGIAERNGRTRSRRGVLQSGT